MTRPTILHRTPTHIYRTAPYGRTVRRAAVPWWPLLAIATVAVVVSLLVAAVVLGIAEGGVW